MANKFKILAFDPGLTTTGWSLLEGSLDSDKLTVLKIGEIHPGPTVGRASYRDEVERYDKRTISLAYLKEQIISLLDETKPDAIAAEDIYINMQRPQAYGALCMWIAIVRALCRDFAAKYLVTIPTKICKKAMTNVGSSGKETVQQCIVNNKKIEFKDPYTLQQMTEHEADSIAVAFALSVYYKDLIEKEVEERNEKRNQCN